VTNKHPKPSEQPVDRQDDLDRDPAIGQSKSLFGGQSDDEAELIEGENTIEGDVENDAGLGDGADSSLGRTNA
jgi:hypothetical protein